MAIAMVAAGIAACGAPDYTYVKNSAEKTYFRVPASWQKVDQAGLDYMTQAENPDSASAQLRKKMTWAVAYDADEKPTAAHLFSLASTHHPIAYAKVMHLTEEQANLVSFDALRNLFLPVSDSARASALEAGTLLPGFELMVDEVLTPSDGVRGVRVVYNYELPNGVLHTFDQTTFVNNDASIYYMLVIRCSSRCYKERAAEIDAVATSFTVRSKP
ncbi:hypothetical protein GCM10009682_51860 [Luedemannella flava]|uniref:Uncharacterized protein n=1 Tax=Luedemannella flava TaxID=349316 RepID=A0ABN2MHF7_9ACTN